MWRGEWRLSLAPTPPPPLSRCAQTQASEPTCIPHIGGRKASTTPIAHPAQLSRHLGLGLTYRVMPLSSVNADSGAVLWHSSVRGPQLLARGRGRGASSTLWAGQGENNIAAASPPLLPWSHALIARETRAKALPSLPCSRYICESRSGHSRSHSLSR